MRANKFRKVAIIGRLGRTLRQNFQKMVFNSKGDISLVALRLLYTIVDNAGVTSFVEENLRLR